MIKDGQWHLYEWNMDDSAQWTQTFEEAGTGLYGSGGTLGDLTLSGTQSFDSIAIVSSTPADATIRIDQIGFNNAGSLIPEPASGCSPVGAVPPDRASWFAASASAGLTACRRFLVYTAARAVSVHSHGMEMS